MKPLPLLALTALAAFSLSQPAQAADAPPLATVAVGAGSGGAHETSLDAVVEAVRQTTLSTQVAGAVVALKVKAGERVQAGQELLRIDARAAQQGVAASSAQVDAAQAQLTVASRELERQRQLHQKQYISQAALDRAQVQWEAARAQVKALQAQTGAAQTQSTFFTVSAPYSGIVSEVQVTLGDMALPGRALVALHDPVALRVRADMPEAMLGAVVGKLDAVRYELPGQSGPQPAARVELLPTVDPATHTAQLRLDLPVGLKGAVPGMFARVWLPASADAQGGERLYIPAGTVVRRAELNAVYVIDAQGKPRLRQVRLGRATGERIEVLSGLRAGEQLAADPQAAAAASR